jgi:hypothetical protein
MTEPIYNPDSATQVAGLMIETIRDRVDPDEVTLDLHAMAPDGFVVRTGDEHEPRFWLVSVREISEGEVPSPSAQPE